MSPATMPGRCPACSTPLQVERLHCPSCGTDVQGQFRPCPVCALDGEARQLFDLFLAARGNLKEVQRALGISYPTVRTRIDELFQQLEARPTRPSPAEVLARVRRGDLSVEEAEVLLRGSR